VFGTPGFEQDAAGLAALLGHHESLAALLERRGHQLAESPECLALVDDAVHEWAQDPQVAPMLANEVGLYLGSVLVRQVPGATWQVWPNGHPVVRLAGGRELDVTELAARRVRTGGPALPAVLDDAQRRSR
jgi:Family of unknown function (DUF6278)